MIATAIRRGGRLLALLVALGQGASLAAAAPASYPTEALADYVFACMASNGQSQKALRRCSCSIDAIAEQLSYDDYVKAETVLRMRQIPSGDSRTVIFRTTAFSQAIVDKLRGAQIEAELRCF
jgi:hypothetical protein